MSEKKKVKCEKSGVIMDGQRCPGPSPACARCGWNPKVNLARRRRLRKLAAQGRLREWGKG